jgi:hypothetical protein
MRARVCHGRIGRAGQATVGHGEAEHGFLDRIKLAAGILERGGLTLGAQAEHQAAGEQRDDDQHHGQFYKGKTVLRSGAAMLHRGFSRKVDR